jgi:hypothetical protein
MTPLAQWAVKNYTPEVRNVGLISILFFITPRRNPKTMRQSRRVGRAVPCPLRLPVFPTR